MRVSLLLAEGKCQLFWYELGFTHYFHGDHNVPVPFPGFLVVAHHCLAGHLNFFEGDNHPTLTFDERIGGDVKVPLAKE